MKEKLRKMMDNDTEYKDMLERKQRRRERSEKLADGYTVVLLVLCLVASLVFFVLSAWQVGLVFLGISALLGLMTYIDRILDKEKKDEEKKNKRR